MNKVQLTYAFRISFIFGFCIFTSKFTNRTSSTKFFSNHIQGIAGNYLEVVRRIICLEEIVIFFSRDLLYNCVVWKVI